MLAAFRSFAKSFWAVALLGLIILAFVLVGTTDLFQAKIGNSIIKAGDRTVTAQEFRTGYDRYRKALEEQYRQPITLDVALEQGLDKRVLKEMATNEAFLALLQKLGVRTSEKLVNERIRTVPAFFNPVTGQFDEQRYQQVLMDNDLTPDIYMRGLRDSLLQEHFMPAMFAGLRAPRAYAALGGAIALEQRDLAFFEITPAKIGQLPPPTDAELKAFMQENAAQLTRPEFRGFSIVRFSRSAIAPTVTLNPADVQKRFDFEKDSLSQAETRTVIQIPVKDAAQANLVIGRLNKGEDALVVAGSLGIKPLRFDDKPRTAFFDAPVGDAAFKLPLNGVSAPVKTSLGLYVLKVTKVTTGQAATLDAHRAEIEAKVRMDAADRKVSDASRAYEDSHATGADMAASAAKAGLTVVKIPPVNKQGLGRDGRPVAGVSQAVIDAVFDASQGVESEIVADGQGQGEYFIVRVDEVVPPALPSLEEVRVPLVRTLMTRRMADKMQAKADELAARLRKGEAIEKVAASEGLTVSRVAGLSQQTAQQHVALGRELIGSAFNAKKGDVFTARGAQFSIAVGQITATRPGDVQIIARAAEAQREQFSQMLLRDLNDSAQAYASERMKVQTNLKSARLAIGVDAAKAGEGIDQPKAEKAEKADKAAKK